jgi:septal ring factor EnvC (AmiA/AmiB activator)
MNPLTALAQIDIPFEQLLQAQIGTLAAVMAIGLIVMVVAVTLVIGRPVVALLGRMTDAAQAAQAKADAAYAKAEQSQAKAEQTQAGLQSAAASLTAGINAMTRELKEQTAVLIDIAPSLSKQIETHDSDMRAAIVRIETTIETLRQEIGAGHKAQRVEVLGKLDQVLAEIAALKPPPNPPPPVALKVETHTALSEDKAA